MTQPYIKNLCERPMFKIEDRRQMCIAVLAALILDKDCRLDFKGTWKPLTPDEQANWESREHFAIAALSYLVAEDIRQSNSNPPADVESTDTDPVAL